MRRAVLLLALACSGRDDAPLFTPERPAAESADAGSGCPDGLPPLKIPDCFSFSNAAACFTCTGTR